MLISSLMKNQKPIDKSNLYLFADDTSLTLSDSSALHSESEVQ